MSREEVVQKLRVHLVEELAVPADLLDGEAKLLEGGLIDSLGVVSLVTFCEDSLGCIVPAEDIAPDAFETLNTLVDTVMERWSQS